MSTYPPGSHRVDLHVEWATGEIGTFDLYLTHMHEVTGDELLSEALRQLQVQRGPELPAAPFVWRADIS